MPSVGPKGVTGMVDPPDYGGGVHRVLGRVAGGLLAGFLVTLSFPTVGLWPLAAVGAGLLALMTSGVSRRLGALIGFAAGLTYWLPTLSWAGTDFLGVVPWIGLATLEASYIAASGAVMAHLQPHRIRPLVVALVWVGQEALRSRTPYGGFPWGRLAFTQADSPLGRLAAMGGAPAVTFGVALAGALIAYAVRAAYPTWRAPSARQGQRAAITRLGVAAVVTLAGYAVPLPTTGAPVRVLAVQGNVPRMGLDFNAERRMVLDNHVVGTIRALAARPADSPPVDLVVWPENASDIDPIRNPDAAAAIESAVEAAGVPIVVGALLAEPQPLYSNVSLVYRPGAGLTDTYVKQHPVPFAEYIPHREFYRLLSPSVDLLRSGMAAGPGPVIFRTPTTRAGDIASGPSICFEVAYDDLVKANVDLGATLLLVQTNNATFGMSAESQQQLAISRIRAIEHGRSIVHVSTVGVSGLIAPDGTLVRSSALFTAAGLDADLPVRHELTLATRLGPWPEYLACAGLLGATLAALVGPLARRRKDTSHP